MNWGIFWCWETCCKVINRSLFWGCLLHTVNAVCLWTNRVSLTRLFLKTEFCRLWAIPGVDSHFCTLRRRTKSVTFFTNIQSQWFHLHDWFGSPVDIGLFVVEPHLIVGPKVALASIDASLNIEWHSLDVYSQLELHWRLPGTSLHTKSWKSCQA